ncbi:MAG: cupin domain-containing protein [Microbacteriaceae bacterium]
MGPSSHAFGSERATLEKDPNTDQFLRVESGRGTAVMGAEKNTLNFEQAFSNGWSIQVPAGVWRDVSNTRDEPLRLYAIYAPSLHAAGVVQATSSAAVTNHYECHVLGIVLPAR